MAQRSEDIEALITAVELVVTEFYATAVVEAREAAKDKTAEDRLKIAEKMSRAGRQLKLFRARTNRTVGAIAALPRLPAAPGAEESRMDGKPEWTAERVAALHAEVRERMAALARYVETKQVAGDHGPGSDRGLSVQPSTPGAAPETS